MKLKELLLPFTLLVVVSSGGEAEALTPDERQKMDQLAMMFCAYPAASEIEPGSIDMARISVMMHSHNADEKEKNMALFAAMKRQGCD